MQPSNKPKMKIYRSTVSIRFTLVRFTERKNNKQFVPAGQFIANIYLSIVDLRIKLFLWKHYILRLKDKILEAIKTTRF